MVRGTPIRYRRATSQDAQATFDVVVEAENDLLRRAGRAPFDTDALPPERVLRFREFCVRHDADRFWVAEAGDRIVGGAIAILRGRVWYLAALHVRPAFQGRGIGSELIRRSMAGVGPGTTLTVFTEALNPDSNGLYMRFGMLPQETILTFDGPLPAAGGRWARTRGATGGLRVRAIDPGADRALLARLDRTSIGFSRPVDHEFWAGVPGLDGFVLEDGGAVRAYAYISARGAVGPAATVAPEDVPAVLTAVAGIARDHEAPSLHVRIAGSARPGVEWLVGAGLRLTGIGLMLSSRRVGRLDRYITSGADALY